MQFVILMKNTKKNRIFLEQLSFAKALKKMRGGIPKDSAIAESLSLAFLTILSDCEDIQIDREAD